MLSALGFEGSVVRTVIAPDDSLSGPAEYVAVRSLPIEYGDKSREDPPPFAFQPGWVGEPSQNIEHVIGH